MDSTSNLIFEFNERILYDDRGDKMIYETAHNKASKYNSFRDGLLYTKNEVNCEIFAGKIMLGSSIIKPETTHPIISVSRDDDNNTIVVGIQPYKNELQLVHPIEVWHKIDDHYILKQKKELIYKYSQFPQGWSLINIICTRQYYLLEMEIYNNFNGVTWDMTFEINVYDKHTCEYVMCLWGKDMVAIVNDYQPWWKMCLEELKKEKVLKKLNVNLLEIILSYVG